MHTPALDFATDVELLPRCKSCHRPGDYRVYVGEI